MWQRFKMGGTIQVLTAIFPKGMAIDSLAHKEIKRAEFLTGKRVSIIAEVQELGVDPIVVEKILNHELMGVMAVYNRHQCIDKRKEALEKLCLSIDFYNFKLMNLRYHTDHLTFNSLIYLEQLIDIFKTLNP